MNFSSGWLLVPQLTNHWQVAIRALEETMVNIQYNIAIYNITLHHDITQRTHARLFLERIDAFLPSLPHPSEEHQFEFEFEFNYMHIFD